MDHSKKRNGFCMMVLIPAIGMILQGSYLQAQLKVTQFNDFIVYEQPRNTEELSPLFLKTYGWLFYDSAEYRAYLMSMDSDEDASPTFVRAPLVYPSPLVMSENDGVLAYELNKAMDLEFRLYDMFGYELLKQNFEKWGVGAKKGYQEIPFNRAFFKNKSLPTGVYFFVFLHNGKVVAKGKFAVVP